MHSYLEDILKEKKREVDLLKKRKTLAEILRADKLSVIAEIKRQSPSVGKMNEIKNPLDLAKEYVEGGASAISILTDAYGFNGSLDDLKLVASSINIPILRKDFIIDPIQIPESISAGASIILLIVAVLGTRTEGFVHLLKQLGIDAIVEIHDDYELEIAANAGADIIGINSRNLSTFEVDMSIARRLASRIPSHIVKVAESGIKTIEDAIFMREAGFDAVLVGEALVKSSSPKDLIRAFRI